MDKPLVTILIPNYRTPVFTKLCLRLLRKHTNLTQAKIVVIDNHSADESLDYLRTLTWITLMERNPEPDDTPAMSHSRALDCILKTVDTPYVLSLHTDTLIKHDRWLDFLLQHIENKPQIAGVGSWKLESKSSLQSFAKMIERQCQLLWYQLTRTKHHTVQGVGENYYYLRSHCALYRTALLHQHHLTFSMERKPAGKVMHKKLCDCGYQMIFLPSGTLGRYMDHVNHATTALNPHLGSRPKSLIKGEKRIRRALQKIQAKTILQNAQLDK